VLFLTPFNAIMLGFWIWFGAWLRERLYRPAAGGMRVITDGVCTRVRLPRWSACWWGLGTSGGLGFVLTFIIGFATQMRPSLSLVFFAIAAVCGAGLVVYLWQRSNINSGVDDLIINAPAQTLQLPLTFGRRETVTVNLPDIEFVWVEKVVHRSSKGGISYTYAPTLALRGVAPGSQKLADWSDKLKADDFAQWLAPQLGVPLNSEQAPAL